MSDFNLLYRGCRVDYVKRDGDGNLHFWGGNPDEDKFAEEFAPTYEERKLLIEAIIEYM